MSGRAAAQPDRQWKTDVDANGHKLYNLHELEMIDDPVIESTDGSPLEFRIAGQRVAVFEEPAPDGSTNIVQGHPSNDTEDDVQGATIAGGGTDGDPNLVTGDFGTVSGGAGNAASRFDAVGGGLNNTVTADFSTIGGGDGNTAAGDEATVGGGSVNVASGTNATVGGGDGNEASGGWSTVPGGLDNTASGGFSFAAGRAAKTETSGGTPHTGTAVFGDSSTTPVRSQADDQFVVQAGGGAIIHSSSDLSTGVELPAGDGSWSSLSTRTAKTNVRPVDPRSVLAGVERLDIGTWEYDGNGDATQMGPMAEDFHAAFELGEGEKRISTVDADGVALAAIQGLAERVERDTDALREENRTLRGENEAVREESETLRERCETVETRLAALEERVSGLAD